MKLKDQLKIIFLHTRQYVFSNIHFHKHSTTMRSLNAISYYGSNSYKKIDIYNLPEELRSSTIQNLIPYMWRYKSSSE